MPTFDVCRVLARVLATTLGVALAAVGASAQTVSNPRIVEFAPSPDHGAKLPDGQPAVSRYDFEVYLAGAAAPFHTVNLGKPAPQSDGNIRVDFSTQVAGWPLPGGVYEARVSAVGPGGKGRSDVSNPFTFDQPTPACSYSVSPSSQAFGASGGSGTFTVTTGSSCTWSAMTSVGWIVPAKTSGSGGATVGYTVSANAGTTARTGTINVNGRTLTVKQSGTSDPGSGSCTYDLVTPTPTFGAAGGQGAVSVMTGDGCPWTLVSGAAWLALAARDSTGAGRVSFTVAANTGTLERKTTISLASKSVTITQAGTGTKASEPTCSYSLSPAQQAVAAAGGSGTIQVTAPDGCRWTAVSQAAWLQLLTAVGSGSGAVSFMAAANTGSGIRSASVAVADQVAAVAQDSQQCTYRVEPRTSRLSRTGGTGTFTIETQAGCTWTINTSAEWLSPSVTSGKGTTTISFAASANSAKSARTGAIAVGTQRHEVTVSGLETPKAPGNLRIVVTR